MQSATQKTHSKRNSLEAIEKRTLPGIRHGRHCVFHMHIHLVFVTKYRKPIFSVQILKDLEDIFRSVCQDFESELKEFNGESDHVHVLVNYPPKVAVSKLVNSLKGVSARLLRTRNYPGVCQSLWGGSLWSPSYFAGSCGGASLDMIQRYIQQQKTPLQGVDRFSSPR